MVASLTEAKCFELWGDNNIGWIFNEGDEGAGSILTMWHKDVFTYINHQIGKGYIAFFGHHLKSKKDVSVINVYSPCNLNEKKSLWEEISNIKSSKQNFSWCILGDFNAVRNVNERKGIILGIPKRMKLKTSIYSLKIIACWNYHQLEGNTHGIERMVQLRAD